MTWISDFHWTLAVEGSVLIDSPATCSSLYSAVTIWYSTELTPMHNQWTRLCGLLSVYRLLRCIIDRLFLRPLKHTSSGSRDSFGVHVFMHNYKRELLFEKECCMCNLTPVIKLWITNYVAFDEVFSKIAETTGVKTDEGWDLGTAAAQTYISNKYYVNVWCI